MKMPKISFKKDDMRKALKTAKLTLTENMPTVAAGFAIAGTIAAVALTIPATKKYLEEIEEIKAERLKEQEEKIDAGELKEEDAKVNPLTKKDYFVTGAKHYWYVVVVAGLTIGGIYVCVKSANKKIKGLAVAAAAAETALGAKENAIENLLGPKKATEVEMEANKNIIEQTNVIPDDLGLIEHSCHIGNCEMLCLDALSMRPFYGDPQQIEKHLIELNAQLLEDGYVSVNEYYSALGISGVDWGEFMTWNYDSIGTRLIRYEIEYQGHSNGKTVAIIKLKTLPKQDWRSV